VKVLITGHKQTAAQLHSTALIGVHCQNYTKDTNRLCGQNGELFTVKFGGTYSYHQTLKWGDHVIYRPDRDKTTNKLDLFYWWTCNTVLFKKLFSKIQLLLRNKNYLKKIQLLLKIKITYGCTWKTNKKILYTDKLNNKKLLKKNNYS
jgi:hypothetical protein